MEAKLKVLRSAILDLEVSFESDSIDSFYEEVCEKIDDLERRRIQEEDGVAFTRIFKSLSTEDQAVVRRRMENS